MTSDVVGVLLVVQEAVLRLAQGARGDIGGAADACDKRKMKAKSTNPLLLAFLTINPWFGCYRKTDRSPFTGLWLQGDRWLLHVGVDQPRRERQAVALTVGKRVSFPTTFKRSAALTTWYA